MTKNNLKYLDACTITILRLPLDVLKIIILPISLYIALFIWIQDRVVGMYASHLVYKIHTKKKMMKYLVPFYHTRKMLKYILK